MTDRDRSALHASCTGGIADVHVFETAEQPALLAAITLPYDARTGQVLTGTHKGQLVWDAIQAEIPPLLKLFAHVTVAHVTVRPWQRWWQRTPAKRLIPACPLSGPKGDQA